MTQTTTELKSLIVRESKDLTIAQKLARRGLLRAFSKARYGRLTIADGEDTFAFEGTESGPDATHYNFRSTSLGRRCISRVGWQW